MLEELRAQEGFRVLLLLLLEVTVCLLPGDAVDQVPDHVQDVLFYLVVQRKLLFDVSDVQQKLLLAGDAALVSACLHLEQIPWVTRQAN